MDCYKIFNEDEEPKHLKVYNPGESFGELALLYNAPRAATIKAKDDSTLFALDRDTFNHIVKVKISQIGCIIKKTWFIQWIFIKSGDLIISR